MELGGASVDPPAGAVAVGGRCSRGGHAGADLGPGHPRRDRTQRGLRRRPRAARPARGGGAGSYLPAQAMVVRDGRRLEVAATDVVVGDLLVLHEGDSVCADASVLSGAVEVDMSAVTGESAPVVREWGSTRRPQARVIELRTWCSPERRVPRVTRSPSSCIPACPPSWDGSRPSAVARERSPALSSSRCAGSRG